MSQKLVAYAVVFLLAFILCLRLLEASNLVAVSVDTQVSAGQIEVEFAPRLARMLELAAAAVVSLFITTGRIGDFAAAGLIRLWNLLRSRLSKTIPSDSPFADPSLDEVLTEHDERLAKVEGALKAVHNKHNALVDRTKPHQAEITELQVLCASLDLRLKAIESESQAAPAARVRSTRKKAGA